MSSQSGGRVSRIGRSGQGNLWFRLESRLRLELQQLSSGRGGRGCYLWSPKNSPRDSLGLGCWGLPSRTALRWLLRQSGAGALCPGSAGLARDSSGSGSAGAANGLLGRPYSHPRARLFFLHARRRPPKAGVGFILTRPDYVHAPAIATRISRRAVRIGLPVVLASRMSCSAPRNNG